MRSNAKQYIVLLGIFVLSICSVLIVGEDSALQGFLGAPAVLALFGGLFQLLRDQATHEQTLERQSKEMRFAVGTASHMANRAFDKHSEFCKKYMEEIHNTVSTLFREGDTERALDHAAALWTLRQKYAVWLTDEMNAELDRFEGGVRKLGANAHFVQVTTGERHHNEKRALKIDENFQLFGSILGLDGIGEEIDEHMTVEAVKRTVRGILGIEELSRLRAKLIREATHAVSTNGT